MQRASWPEVSDFTPYQTRMQRSQSLSGDRTVISASPLFSSPPPVSPDPAYIAASAASQIVTSDHQSQIDDWFDGHGRKTTAETIIVSPAALALVNGFLDQLLFSVLAFSRSSSIAALRPAVVEVLKPRLAKDAIAGADQELHEFLGGGDGNSLPAFHSNPQPAAKWDRSLVWRRTRLRCMVYTRLGDMEEEDEEMYLEQAQMEDANDTDRPPLSEWDIISPAAAIFLTSILEFIGEHALMIAGDAASNRVETLQQQSQREEQDPLSGSKPRLVVEDVDVEKLAFNTTLGRLWRSWKKRVRASSVSSSRPLSREVMRRRAASASASPCLSEVDESSHLHESIQRPSVQEILEEEQEAGGEAGGAAEEDEKSGSHAQGHVLPTMASNDLRTNRGADRPRSMMVYPQPSTDLSAKPSVLVSLADDPEQTTVRPPYRRKRKRASSLPNLGSEYRAIALHEGYTPLRAVRVDTTSPSPGFSQPKEDAPSLREDPGSASESGSDTASTVGTTAAHRPPGAIDLGTLSGFTGPQAARGSDSGLRAASNTKVWEAHPERNLHTTEAVEIAARGPQAHDVPAHGLFQAAARANAIDARGTLGGWHKAITAPAVDMESSPNIDQSPNVTVPNRTAAHQPLPNGKPVTGMPEREWDKHLESLQRVTPAPLATLGSPNSLERTVFESKGIGQKENKAYSIPEAIVIPRSEPRLATAPVFDRENPSHNLRSTLPTATDHESRPEHGAPSLTPLRELVETAHDTSDDSSSFTPSHHGAMIEAVTPRKPVSKNNLQSVTSVPPSTTPETSDPLGSKHPDRRKELPAVNIKGAERAAVQRITPSPGLPRDPFTPLPRTSTSSNREARPHTPASANSQFSQKIKGFIGRESADDATPTSPRRKSSVESGSTISDKRSTKAPKAFTKQRSFEQLIQSDETIQYTLTPKNMRDMELPDPSKPYPTRPSEANDATDGNTEPDKTESGNRPLTARSLVSLKGLNGLRSNPPTGARRHGSASSGRPSSQAEINQLPRSRTGSVSTLGLVSINGRVSANGKIGPIVPRDPRARNETTSEIAEFIRSTGPEMVSRSSSGAVSPSRAGAPSPNAPTSGGSSRRAISTSPRAESRDIGRSSPAAAPKGSVAGTLKKSASKLQAREATVSYDNQTSELIDFIRQGPAPDRIDGSHRIPRAVAPFRRTMDSDEIQALGNEKARESSSVTSTQDSLAPSKSIHSSSNSRTGLLDAARRSSARKVVSTPTGPKPLRSDEPPHPLRKQHRGKDPYAVDTDSENDDRVTPSSKLNIPSAFDGIPKPIRNTARRTASGPDMQGATVRTTSVHSTQTSRSKHTISAISVMSNPRGRNFSQNPPIIPREASPHLTTQIGTRYDSYKPTRPTYAAHVDRERNSRRQAQPRPEREDDSSLGELADFFKNSGPPPTPVRAKTAPVLQIVGGKEERGFRGIFSRKKKVSAAS